MLEALCSRHDSKDRTIRYGDIVVLALPGHPWGSEERKLFDIIPWKDDEIEAKLVQAGQTVVSYPYAVQSGTRLTATSSRRLGLLRRTASRIRRIIKG